MDYTPERGAVPGGIDIAHGVIQATHADKTNSVGEAIVRRLRPHGPYGDWCHYHELLVPSCAPDTMAEPYPLVARYEAQLLPSQVDLLTVTTLRFAHAMACHVQWELARSFVRSELVAKRSLAVLLVHHLPGLAGRATKPHIHALGFARALHGSNFGGFTDLTKVGAKALLGAAWAAHLEAGA